MSNKALAVLLGSLVVLLFLPGILSAQAGKWESIGPEGGRVISLIQDQKNPFHFWAAAGGNPSRLYESTNRCATWTELATWDNNILSLLATPARPGWLFAFSEGGLVNMMDTSAAAMQAPPGLLYASSDGGKTWSSKSFPSIYNILLVRMDPKDGETIHVLAQARVNAGIVYLKSTDGGDTWSPTALVQRMGWVTALAVDPRNTSVVYVGVNVARMTNETRMLRKSYDGGKTFTGMGPTTGKLSSPITDIVMDPAVPGTVYLTTYDRMFRTTDDGTTWERISGFQGMPQKLWIDPKGPRHLILVTDKCLAESKDGGENWQSESGTRAGRGISSLTVELGNPSVIFASTSAGIFRTADMGKSWTASHKGIRETQVTALCAVPSAPGTVFASLMMNAVYKTTDGGAPAVRWQQLPLFYTCTNLADIKTDTHKPYRVIALEGGG